MPPKGRARTRFAVTAALKNTFAFRNGISGANNGRNVGTGLADMINPNLDAEYPVILGILGRTGHAVVADGYGYDASTRIKTLYHHVNMGWGGHEDIWYNLPDIGNYDTIPVCIYNIFPEGTGEIISGRVTDASGQPIWRRPSGPTCTRNDMETHHEQERHLRPGPSFRPPPCSRSRPAYPA